MSDGKRYPGRVQWRELMTTDVERAKGFYGELLPWRFKTEDMGEGFLYTLISVGDKQIGGLFERPPGVPAPSHWSSYVSVDDVDAAAKKAQQLGGKLLKEPMDVPNVGRMAAIQDPDGAVIWAYRGAMDDSGPGRPNGGEFCWETLVAKDTTRAKQFYGEVFGWQALDAPMPLFTVDGTPDGMVADFQTAQNMPPCWITYVVIQDLPAMRERATKLGGNVLVPKIDVPGVGSFALVADPTGGVLGLFEPAMPNA